ncbi:MAG: Hint domain-containing protein [Pseudomonadota bacterium]
MANVSGSDDIGGANQSASNNFDDSLFWFEWIELDGTTTATLSEAGFDITNGDLGPGQTIYNAGGFDAVNVPSAFGTFGDDGSDFAVRLSTTLTVDTGGTYTFNLGSDDGSRLYVDGVEVIDNDGLQPLTFEDGSVTLGPGQHEIVIIFFERAGAQELQATISGPDTGGVPIDLAAANVQANVGDDSVASGDGDDTIDGGDGDDSILSGAGNDLVDGGDGADTIQGGGGDDTVDGGDGNDVIQGDGDNGGETLTRQSFNWDAIPDPDNGGTIDDGDELDDGTVQDTGLINVTVSFDSLGGDVEFAFDTFTAFTAGIDSGGETVSTDSSGQLVADDDDPSTGVATFAFSANTPGIEDEVQNLSFRINDIDANGGGNAEDSVTVRAFDAAGEEVVVSLIPGGNLTLSDTGGAPGDDTATQTAGSAGTGTTVGNSLLVNIAGPVARLEITFTGSDENPGGVRVTDIFFDAVSSSPDVIPGDDVLTGGAGDDIIDGGAGDDQITGGTGSDTLSGDAGSDEFLITDAEGGDIITGGEDADGSDIDVIRVQTPFRVDYTNDDPTTESGTISFLDDDGNVISTTTFSEIESVVCFAKGTLIATPKGDRAVEDLKVGDMVKTLDNGPQPILWIKGRELQNHDLHIKPNLRPIRIKAGALGPLMPRDDLMVSPQHRILVRSKIAIRMFDAAEVLVPAKKLLPLEGVEIAMDLHTVWYYHFKCAEHEVVDASGALAETLYLGPQALEVMSPEALDELHAIFGEEISEPAVMARLVPPGRQINRLVERHVKNNKPICSYEI